MLPKNFRNIAQSVENKQSHIKGNAFFKKTPERI